MVVSAPDVLSEDAAKEQPRNIPLKEPPVTKTAAKFARPSKKSPAKAVKVENGRKGDSPIFAKTKIGTVPHSRPAKRPLENDFLAEEVFEAEESHAAVAVEADVDDELEADLEVGPDVEAEEGPVTGDDDQIDDPIRIYLMQMGEIPLLSRPEEIVAAKQIKRARRRFRHIMLATDYVLHAAVEMLKAIRDGRTRLDRTMEVSVINIREKKRLIKVLEPNVRTLDHIMADNRQDFSHCHSQGPADEAAPPSLAAADRAARPRRAADRGTRPADAALAADPGEGQADPAADGRNARGPAAVEGPVARRRAGTF